MQTCACSAKNCEQEFLAQRTVMQCIPERVDSVGFTAGQAVRRVLNNIPISNDRRAYFGQRSGDISRRAIARGRKYQRQREIGKNAAHFRFV